MDPKDLMIEQKKSEGVWGRVLRFIVVTVGMAGAYYIQAARSARWNHNEFRWNLLAYRDGFYFNLLFLFVFGPYVVLAAWNVFRPIKGP